MWWITVAVALFVLLVLIALAARRQKRLAGDRFMTKRDQARHNARSDHGGFSGTIP